MTPEEKKELDHPSWALQLSGSGPKFGNQDIQTGYPKNYGRFAAMGEVDWQPIYHFGILGIGGSFGYHPTNPTFAEDTPNLNSGMSFGGHLRYQLRYFHNQILVPVVGYSVESVQYDTPHQLSGNIMASGPVYGLWLFLNLIDPISSTSFRRDIGVRRTYLTGEIRRISGTDAGWATLVGSAFHLGFRFEW